MNKPDKQTNENQNENNSSQSGTLWNIMRIYVDVIYIGC